MKLKTSRERRIGEEIAVLEQERDDLRARKTVKCLKCERRTQLSKAILIRKHHYIRPYSCSGGDYWEFSNEYQVLCTKCGNITRAYIRSFDEDWQIDGGRRIGLGAGRHSRRPDHPIR